MKNVALLGMSEIPHLAQHLLPDCSCLRSRNVSQQDDKFIAAEPRDKIIVAYGCSQLLGGKPEQLISRWMSARIIDVFKLIKVYEAQRAPLSCLSAGCNLVIELRD